jgi:hypothetical protein
MALELEESVGDIAAVTSQRALNIPIVEFGERGDQAGRQDN